MPALFNSLRLPAAAALLALGASAAMGSDHAPAPKAAATPAAEAEPAKPAKAGPRVVQDPMDMLREKLAAKLGASKAPGTDNPNVVRVVSKANAADDHAPAIAPRPARRKPAAAAAPDAPDAHAAHWDYAGSGGPETWGQMKPEFAKCSSGTRQSPIDIRDGIKVNLDAVQFDYKASGFRVVDNGHTVQVNVGPGNAIEVMGRRYDLVQFHFHRPSEERIDGRQFDMVVHLVHKDIDGRLAVVAVLLDRGSAQPIVQNVWNNLPLEKGDEVAARGTINLNELLPAERSYFTYMGSLTTPPCSEGVLWMVMKQPVQVSADQIGIFARLYPMNARPIQSASGRLIKESN
ncbi:MAG: carbonic anhydrase family protein [Burkholderiales bacterium]